MGMGMRPNRIEDSAINRIDNKVSNLELRGQGKPTEEFAAFFLSGIPGLKVRPATLEEDMGPENGGHQTIDLVVSFSDTNKPAFAIQITSSDRRGVMEKKLKEIRDHPFIRLDTMIKGDSAIPKVLVALEARQIKNFFENPDLTKHPELSIKVLDDILRSLAFDLARTQISLEKEAVSKLIGIFEEEKKKYIH
jgi:hypothetical protein